MGWSTVSGFFCRFVAGLRSWRVAGLRLRFWRWGTVTRFWCTIVGLLLWCIVRLTGLKVLGFRLLLGRRTVVLRRSRSITRFVRWFGRGLRRRLVSRLCRFGRVVCWLGWFVSWFGWLVSRFGWLISRFSWLIGRLSRFISWLCWLGRLVGWSSWLGWPVCRLGWLISWLSRFGWVVGGLFRRIIGFWCWGRLGGRQGVSHDAGVFKAIVQRMDRPMDGQFFSLYCCNRHI